MGDQKDKDARAENGARVFPSWWHFKGSVVPPISGGTTPEGQAASRSRLSNYEDAPTLAVFFFA
jgi:hypothetical protein